MAETEDGIRELHKEIFSLYKELMDDQILHSSAGTRFVTIEAATTAAKNLPTLIPKPTCVPVHLLLYQTAIAKVPVPDKFDGTQLVKV